MWDLDTIVRRNALAVRPCLKCRTRYEVRSNVVYDVANAAEVEWHATVLCSPCAGVTVEGGARLRRLTGEVIDQPWGGEDVGEGCSRALRRFERRQP